jgi:hypothetical protein
MQGRFTVGVRDGHAWFFAPDGARFLSQAVNAVKMMAPTARRIEISTIRCPSNSAA